MEYEQVEPFGEMRSELRHGQQMALTAELNRDKKKKRTAFVPKDFMNFVDDEVDAPKIKESPQSIAARISTQFFPKAKRFKKP
jgi:hypothetical protein